MTVIAARKTDTGIVFASDAQVTRGWRTQPDQTMETSKLFQVNGMTIGGAGLMKESRLLELFCQRTKPAAPTELDMIEFFLAFMWDVRKFDRDFEPYNNFLIAFENELFEFCDTADVHVVPEYAAIGSGSDFALAVMHGGKGPAKAVEVACELDIYCSKPVRRKKHVG